MEELAREGGGRVIQRDSAVPVKWRKAATGPGWAVSAQVISVSLPHRGHSCKPQMPASVVSHFWDKVESCFPKAGQDPR